MYTLWKYHRGVFCGVRRTATEKIKQKNQLGLPRWLSGKQSACQCRRRRFNPWVQKIPWRRKWQPTPVFLPGKSQRQRNLVGYSPWGHKRDGHNLITKEWQEQWDSLFLFFPSLFSLKGASINDLCWNFHWKILFEMSWMVHQ